MDEKIREVDRCRKVAQNFYHALWYLHEGRLLDDKYMKAKGFAESGNFLRLVEPLEKANFTIVSGLPAEDYLKGRNRPVVFAQIETAMKDNETKNFF